LKIRVNQNLIIPAFNFNWS